MRKPISRRDGFDDTVTSTVYRSDCFLKSDLGL